MKTKRLSYLIVAILTIWLIILSSILYTNNNQEQEQVVNKYNVLGFSTDFTKVVDDNKTSIVSINADGKISSGFVYKTIDNKTYIITSYHGVSNSNHIGVIFSSSYQTTGKLVNFDRYSDLAVLMVEIPFEVKPINIGNAFALNAGEFVIGIGTPVSLDYASSIELGMVSSLKSIENSITVDEKVYNYYLDVVQLSSNLMSGYSGGPIINMNGDVVGMITMSYNQNFNFALTGNELKIIADKIINGEEVNKLQLDIKGKYVSSMATYEKSSLNIALDIINGIYVEKIGDNSILTKIGVRKGDVISKINGIDITNIDDLYNVLYNLPTSLEVQFYHENEKYKYMVNLND